MSDTESLKHYIQAREAQRDGHQEVAVHQLEAALGSPHANTVISDNLDVLLALDHPAGEMVLDILRVEMTRRRDG